MEQKRGRIEMEVKSWKELEMNCKRSEIKKEIGKLARSDDKKWKEGKQ